MHVPPGRSETITNWTKLYLDEIIILKWRDCFDADDVFHVVDREELSTWYSQKLSCSAVTVVSWPSHNHVWCDSIWCVRRLCVDHRQVNCRYWCRKIRSTWTTWIWTFTGGSAGQSGTTETWRWLVVVRLISMTCDSITDAQSHRDLGHTDGQW